LFQFFRIADRGPAAPGRKPFENAAWRLWWRGAGNASLSMIRAIIRTNGLHGPPAFTRYGHHISVRGAAGPGLGML